MRMSLLKYPSYIQARAKDLFAFILKNYLYFKQYFSTTVDRNSTVVDNLSTVVEKFTSSSSALNVVHNDILSTFKLKKILLFSSRILFWLKAKKEFGSI